MKFIVSSTALSSHLQAISRVINSKNALPILDCFLFELEDGTLSVTVSDSETTMVTTVEGNESDTNGRFAVCAPLLSHEICRSSENFARRTERNSGTTSHVLDQSGQLRNNSAVPEWEIQSNGTECGRISAIGYIG